MAISPKAARQQAVNLYAKVNGIGRIQAKEETVFLNDETCHLIATSRPEVAEEAVRQWFLEQRKEVVAKAKDQTIEQPSELAQEGLNVRIGSGDISDSGSPGVTDDGFEGDN